MAKPLLRREAERLRRDGAGVREIARRLGVAQSSVSVWTRHVAPARLQAHADPLAKAPRLVLWNSGETRRCARCRRLQPLELFGRTPAGRQAWCRPCFRAHARARGKAHTAQVRRSVVRRRATARAWIIDYLRAHPCVDCRLPDVDVLEFDHIGADKAADVGALVASGSALRRIVEEVQKCEVVCANCHRRRTASRGRWLRASPTWRLELGARSTPAARNRLLALEHLAEHGCIDCGETDIVVLDFDHVGPKRRGVMALAASGVATRTLAAEIANCEVRCACCHRRVTITRAGQYRSRLDESGPPAEDDPQLRRDRARTLRGEGRTIKEIATMVRADPKTVGRWVADLPLSDEQRASALEQQRAARVAADTGPGATELKRCTRCGQLQPAAAFSWNGPRRHSNCKVCFAERNAARTAEQRATAAAKQRERRRRAKELKERGDDVS